MKNNREKALKKLTMLYVSLDLDYYVLSRLSNSRGGLSKRGGGAKVVKSLIKSTERHDFCQKLINVEEGVNVKKQ